MCFELRQLVLASGSLSHALSCAISIKVNDCKENTSRDGLQQFLSEVLFLSSQIGQFCPILFLA